MIDRYTRKEMAKIWSAENKFAKMLEVEVAVARVQAKNKLIPEKAARAIATKSKFKVERIAEIEKTTKHDVIAFVSNVAENVGEYGKFVHYGLTSSDVLDTAFSLVLREAGEILFDDLEGLERALTTQAKKHVYTLCAGRTHGMHAEITSFGVKLGGYIAELKRQRARLKTALDQAMMGKLSGAVGTYSSQSPKIEKEVCARLRLAPEPLATQVVPRDRHAEVLSALALIGGFIERLAVELRHLQRTEVGEVVENFTPGQKGSSAMPHKKNPISAENLTGLSRLLRSYLVAGLENMALWHERDISHSSVERVVFPDAFIVCDYALHRLSEVIAKLYIDKDRMRQNADISQGQLFSSQVLLLLVRKGLSREDAYALVQELSHGLKKGEHLKTALGRDARIKKLASKKEVDALFRENAHRDRLRTVLSRVIKL